MADPREHERTIERALAADGSDVGVRARIVDQWLELTAAADAVPLAHPQLWSMLRFNADLNGPLRLALAPGAHGAHFRGEMFVEDDTNLDTRVEALLESARSALRALHDSTRLGRPSLAAESAKVGKTPRDGHPLVQLCAEAGWPCTERASSRIEIAIDCGRASYQAHLDLTDDGALSAVVDLVDASTLTQASRTATAFLLLIASAVVRSVKAVVVKRDGVEHAGLAAACESPRSGAGLDRALAALSVGCGLAGCEAQALRHEALAREYLAWCAPPLLVDESPDDDIVNNQRDNNNQYEVEERPCLQQL
jgi:hypothetical protein